MNKIANFITNFWSAKILQLNYGIIKSTIVSYPYMCNARMYKSQMLTLHTQFTSAFAANSIFTTSV